MEFVNRIARDFETKFENVTIHGAFGSVGDLMDVINAIYDNICTKGMMSRVRVHLDSRIKDDDGNVKTLANMIANAYVTPNIVERDNITDIIYTKFDKNMTIVAFKLSDTSKWEMIGDNCSIPDYTYYITSVFQYI